jgi:GDPmannose 4,6-dehydratase
VSDLLGDFSKAKKILKWKPKIDIKQLISEMIDEEYKSLN